ncbi:hypothetical protein J2S74_001628 [Evansella vedderi]|uniref:Post-transcriptional regulator n=1 Tax=Evansella vedderi TaxID=38282 RepID=A0ABT9ZSP0_9BACI|nr:post-transcriptional regulator [Evansella vedderi]MDQ0254253.1 hypothetical protein [Evansella vedderi]
MEQWDNWKAQLEPVLKSKAEEWQMLGYDRVTEDDVWACFLAKRSRMDIPDPVLTHWIVGELFRLKANDYMNWLTVEAYKGPNWFDKEEPLDLSQDLSQESATKPVKPVT